MISKPVTRSLQRLDFTQALKQHISRWNAGFCEALKNVKKKLPPVYVGSYFFWDRIMKNHTLQLSNPEGELVSIHHPDIDPLTRQDLNYTGGMPISIILDHGIEVSVTENNQTQSWKIMYPGHIVGIHGGLQSTTASFIFSKAAEITAGARSLFTLANLGEKPGLAGLQKYVGNQFHLDRSLDWYNQGALFSQLIQAKQTQSPWQVIVVFLTREWLELLKKPAFQPLYAFLLKYIYDDTIPLREQASLDNILSQALYNTNLPLELYLFKILESCYYITRSNRMAFSVAIDNTFAPISQLEQILLNHFNGLKSAPVFMQCTDFKHNSYPHYYSLGYPSTIETRRPKYMKPKSHLAELDVLLHAQRKMHQYLLNEYFGPNDVVLHKQFDQVKAEYFHHAPNQHPIIRPSSELIHYNPLWEKKQKQLGLPINWNHSFFRGLIQIGIENN